MGVVVPCGGEHNKSKMAFGTKGQPRKQRKFTVPVFDAHEVQQMLEPTKATLLEERNPEQNQVMIDNNSVDEMGNRESNNSAIEDVESCQSLDSQQLPKSDENDLIIQEKLSKLDEIRAEIQKYEWKISSSNELRLNLLAKLVMHRWSTKASRSTSEYDVFACAKYRTRTAEVVEGLLRLLCKLDQVQSEGSEVVRSERKILVELINKDLLPRADSELEKAKSLVQFNDKIVKLFEVMKEKREEDTKMVESGENAMEETEVKPVEISENTEPEVSKPEKASHAHMEIDEGKKEADQEADQPSKDGDVNFTSEELPHAYLVKLKLPTSEKFNEIRFNLKSDSELVVSGRTFELPIEVNPSKAVLEESTYRKHGKSIVITIPKRKRRAVERPSRLWGMNPHASSRDLLRESDFYRPLVWGW